MEEEFEESKAETTRSLCSSASHVTSYNAFLLKGVICKHFRRSLPNCHNRQQYEPYFPW